MPRVKSLQHYPTRYAEIVRECALEGKLVQLAPMPTKQALSLRGHWYGWVAALKAEAERRRKASAPDLDLYELERLQPMVMLDVRDLGMGKAQLTFQSREHSWQAAALRTATITQGASRPTATNLDADAQRLLDIQKEVDNGQG